MIQETRNPINLERATITSSEPHTTVLADFPALVEEADFPDPAESDPQLTAPALPASVEVDRAMDINGPAEAGWEALLESKRAAAKEDS